MIWQGLFDPTLSARICLTLLHSLWQIAIVACVAWGAERLLRRRSVESEYGIQVFALFVSLLLPPLTFAWLGTGEQRSSFSPTATHIVRSAASEKRLTRGGKQATTAPVPAFSETSHDGSPAAVSGSPTVADRAAGPLWMRCSPWVAAVYGMGVVVMLARLAAGVVYARRLARRGRIVCEGPLVDCARAVADAWSMRAVPAIVQVEEIVIPKVVGLVWARILVPATAMSGLSPAELEMLLIHELAHVRRHDMWINLLQRLAEMVLFFNPAIWLLSRRISGLREYCCDEVACREITHRHSEPRVQYARTLLRSGRTELAGFGQSSLSHQGGRSRPGRLIRERTLTVRIAKTNIASLRRTLARAASSVERQSRRDLWIGIAVAFEPSAVANRGRFEPCSAANRRK